MGKIEYANEHVVLCEQDGNSGRGALRSILSADTDADDFRSWARGLLESYAGVFGLSTYADCPGATLEDFDRRAIEALGFDFDRSIDGVQVFADRSSVMEGSSLVVASRSAVESFVVGLQYMARLSLLSQGDMRSGYVIEKSGVDGGRLGFVAYVPKFFLYGFETMELSSARQIGQFSRIPELEEDESVFCLACDVNPIPIWWPPLIDEKSVLKSAAVVLLSALGNWMSIAPYRVNPVTLEVEVTHDASVVDVLMSEMLAGRVIGCPHCGRPVHLPKGETSTPFCTNYHKVDYLRKAKRALRDGMTVDQVQAAFPDVGKRETIEEWAAKLVAGIRIV